MSMVTVSIIFCGIHDFTLSLSNIIFVVTVLLLIPGIPIDSTEREVSRKLYQIKIRFKLLLYFSNLSHSFFSWPLTFFQTYSVHILDSLVYDLSERKLKLGEISIYVLSIS